MITSGQLRRASRQFWLIFVACVVAVSVFAILIKPAKAASMTMRTGYYVGKGAAGTITVSGLGFQPDLVMIKAATATTSMMWKTSAMPANATSYLSATAQDNSTMITLNANGFTVAASQAMANVQNVVFRWTAFGGSDCTSTGNFCVGTYTGTGAATRTIVTGFQPSIALLKRSTNATAGQLHTASMPANNTELLTATAPNTSGSMIAGFASNGINIGSNDNTNGGIFYYVAFKAGPTIAHGSYTGNATDNRAITGLGFSPNAVLVKNSSATAAVYSQSHHYGNHSSYAAVATADAVGMVKSLDSNGFTVGTATQTNASAATIYWVAFDGDSPPSTSGTFSFKEGMYAGTGSAFSVTGLGFSPDLVIVKRSGSTIAVMRTSLHGGDSTYQMSTTSTAITGAITTMDADGFSIGTNTAVNEAGASFYWQAFGNAYDPVTNSGAADFAIGAYQGNGQDDRAIGHVPFQPDLVVGRATASGAAVMRTSAHIGDLTSQFSTTSDAANIYQSFLSDGYQVGTGAANVAATAIFWFAFKSGPNFQVGAYTGDGLDNRTISIPGFEPDIVWVNRSASQAAVMKTASMAGDVSMSFVASADTLTGIKTLSPGGFIVGTGTPVNASAGIYRYAAWRTPAVPALTTSFVDGTTGIEIPTPVISMSPTETRFQCHQTGGMIGDWPDNILRVQNSTVNPSWSLSIAATGGSTALWQESVYGRTFDYNDQTGTGCSDGGDSDTKSGQMKLLMGGAAVTPSAGCDMTGITQGTNEVFQEGFMHTITLLTAGSSANVGCYWDITDLSIEQSIPQEQLPGDYSLELTVTAVSL